MTDTTEFPRSDSEKNKKPSLELREKFEYLSNCFLKGTKPEILTTQTDILDDYFQNSFAGSTTGIELDLINNPYAIIARGNYGRKEICCQPEVNILFIFSSSIPEKAYGLIKDIIYPLWDLGLRINYSTRTIEECIKHSKESYTYLLSVLDSRFVCGASLLFSRLTSSIREKIVFKNKKEIAAWQLEQDRKRHIEFSSADFLTEPDLLYSNGGLKDLHSILSTAKSQLNIIELVELKDSAIISPPEYEILECSISYIRKVVRFLNITTGKSRLLVKHQAAAAEFMKNGNKNHVDIFLSDLCEHMDNIRKCHNQFYLTIAPKCFALKKDLSNSQTFTPEWISSAKGLISFKSGKKITEKPTRLLEFFLESEKLNMPPNSAAIRLICKYNHLLSNKNTDIIALSKLLEQNLFFSKAGSTVPLAMLDSGILQTLIPELTYAVNKKRAGFYHVHSLCRHLLLTIDYLKEIFVKNSDFKSGDFRRSALTGDPLSIFWAGLLHDFNPESIHDILKRYGKSQDFIEDVCFLTTNHSFLDDIVSTENINDQRVIRSCSIKVKSYQQLSRLHLLTLAHMRATGPIAGTKYKIDDLYELYHKIIEFNFNKTTGKKNQNKGEDKLVQLCSYNGIKGFESFLKDIYLKKLQNFFSDDELFLHLKINSNTLPGKTGLHSEKTKNIRSATILSKTADWSLVKIIGIFLEHKIAVYDYRSYFADGDTSVFVFRIERDTDNIFEGEKWSKFKIKLHTPSSKTPDLLNDKKKFLKNKSSTVRTKIKISPSGTKNIFNIRFIANGNPDILFRVIKLLEKEFKICFFRKTGDQNVSLYTFRIIDSQNRLKTAGFKKQLCTDLSRELKNE